MGNLRFARSARIPAIDLHEQVDRLGPIGTLNTASRRTGFVLTGLLLLLVAGCHRVDDSNSGAVTHTLRWHQGPYTEVQDCHVFKLDNEAALEVSRIHIKFPPGSHHVHMYRSEEPDPDSVKDCWSGIDWNRWHLVIGAQTQAMDWQLPEGLTVPIEPHQQLLVQVHWLNTTDVPLDGRMDVS